MVTPSEMSPHLDRRIAISRQHGAAGTSIHKKGRHHRLHATSAAAAAVMATAASAAFGASSSYAHANTKDVPFSSTLGRSYSRQAGDKLSSIGRLTFVVCLFSLACSAAARGASWHGIDCPLPCNCRADVRLVNCDRGNLRDLPSLLRDVPQDAETIEIGAPPTRPNHLQLGPLFRRFSILRHLRLTNSRIPAIGDGDFHRMTSLETLDLSDNHLTKIAIENFESLIRLETLILDRNYIVSVPSAAFGHLPNLKKLSLAGNNIKGLIPRLLFRLEKLEYLDLSGNPLGQLDPDILVDVPNLKVLKFRGCRIDAIPESFSEMLSKLEEVDLRDNYISVLKPKHIKKLDRLETLLLSGNELKAIEPYTFGGANLRCLALADNYLEDLPRHTFYEANIVNLDLSFNRFRDFDYKLLNPIKDNLLGLNLSGNPMTAEVLRKRIQPLMQLRELSLTHMNLEYLPEDTFSNSDHLAHLNLSRNSLDHFPLALDYVFGTLQSLDVSFNNLSSIDAELTVILKRFNPLKIHGNPWRCDSCNHPFLETLVNMTFQRENCPLHPDCVMCGEPKQLRGIGVGLLVGQPPEVDPSTCVVYRSRLFSRPTYVAILVVSILVVILCFAALAAVIFYTTKFTAYYYTHEEEQEDGADHDNMPLTPTSQQDYPTLDVAKIATIEEFSSGKSPSADKLRNGKG